MALVTKLTVASRLQLLALSEPLAQASGATGDALSGSRPGEVFAGFQVVVLPGEGHKPTVSLSYIRRLYASPAPELDIGTFKNSALILVSDHLAGFHFDINGIFSEQTKGIMRRGRFGQTLSISHPLGRLTVAGELWHFTQPLTSRNAVGNLWAVSYPVRKNLVLDAAFNHGLPLLDAVGSVCGLHVPLASPPVGIPRSKINMTRDQLSLPRLQWFKRHLGNKTARGPLSILTAFGELESLRTQALSQSVRLFVEYTSVRHTPLESEGYTNGRKHGRVAVLSLSALMFLGGACIPGSSLAALRAVSRESDGERDELKEIFAFGAEVTVLDNRMIETGVIVMTNPNHYGL